MLAGSKNNHATNHDNGTNLDSWLTVEEIATLVRKSKSSVHKLWPEWVARYGLKPIRFNGRGRGRLLFSKTEVDAMIEQWRISN